MRFSSEFTLLIILKQSELTLRRESKQPLVLSFPSQNLLGRKKPLRMYDYPFHRFCFCISRHSKQQGSIQPLPQRRTSQQDSNQQLHIPEPTGVTGSLFRSSNISFGSDYPSSHNFHSMEYQESIVRDCTNSIDNTRVQRSLQQFSTLQQCCCKS